MTLSQNNNKKLKRILTKTGKLVKIMQDKMQIGVLNL